MKIEKISENEIRLGSEPRIVWVMVGLMVASVLSVLIVVPLLYFSGGAPFRPDSSFLYLFSIGILLQLIACYFIIKRNIANLPKSIVKTSFGMLEIKEVSYSFSDIASVDVCYQKVTFGKTNIRQNKGNVSANYHVGLRISGKYKAIAYSLSQNDANHLAETFSGFLKVPVVQSSKLFGPL